MDKRYSLKTVIVSFVLGAFIFGIVGAQAATIMAGSDVGYSNTTSGSSATTVQGALDDLYSKFTGGNAAASQILSGKTAYVGGKLVTGTMPERGSSGYVAGDKAWHYDNRIYFGFEHGYYPAASFGGMSNVSERCISYSSLARDIGLTADKLMSGNTILGIAGTASGATNHTGTYTLTSSETGTKDLTASHSYRYINATNVYNKGKTDGATVHSSTYTLKSSETGTKDLTASHSYRYINATNVYNKGVSDTKKGTAGAAQVLSGYTFTNSSSVGASGSMVNATAKSTITLTSSDGRKVLTQTRSSSGDARVWAVTNSDLIDRLSILLPYEGYYSSGTIIAVPYASVRSAIGLTAAKIVSGNSVLGLSGTGGTKNVSWSYVIERSGERLWGDFKVNGTTVLTFYNNGVGTPYDSIGAGSGNGLYGSGNIQV